MGDFTISHVAAAVVIAPIKSHLAMAADDAPALLMFMIISPIRLRTHIAHGAHISLLLIGCTRVRAIAIALDEERRNAV